MSLVSSLVGSSCVAMHTGTMRRDVAPTGDPLSLLRQRKWAKKGDPGEPARPAAGLLCGARNSQPRKTRCVRCAHCAQTGCAKSVIEGRWRALLRIPALLDGSHGKSIRLAAHCRVTTSNPALATPMRSEACGAKSRERTARSAGSGGRARSAPPRLTSRSLSERSEHSERSEFCAAPRTEHRSEPLAQPGAPLPGRLSLPTFFGEAKKVGRPSGRNPDSVDQHHPFAAGTTKGTPQ